MSARVCVTAGLWLCLWILWWDAEENMKTQTICWHLQISGAPGKSLCLSDPDSICHSTALKSPLWELLARSQSSSPFAAGVGMGGHLEPHCSGESLLWGPHDARRWFSPLSGHDSIGLTLCWYRFSCSQIDLEWREMTLTSWASCLLPTESRDYRHPSPYLAYMMLDIKASLWACQTNNLSTELHPQRQSSWPVRLLLSSPDRALSLEIYNSQHVSTFS